MADTTEYKCPSCGAPMHFDIDKQNMICTFCSNSYDFEYIRSNFNEITDEKLSDFDWVERTKYVWEPNILEQLAEYTCPSCGGNIITRNTSASAKCPFCNHEVVVSSNFAGDLRPDMVIPFSRHAEEFAEKYKKNIAGSVYAPNEFKDPSVTDNIYGCYIPIWLYSCTCDSAVRGYDSVRFKIENYPILGTDIKKNIFYSVAPFRFDKAEKFTESCLTGFYASRYSIGAENAMNNADKEIKQVCSTKAFVMSEADYTPQTAVRDSVISDKKLTYYLVPVWFMNVEYKGKDYTFAMNGQTGEFASPNVPLNYKAILYWALLFIFLMVPFFIYNFLEIKSADLSALLTLIMTVMLSLSYLPIALIISGILYYIIFSFLIRGLKSAKSYREYGVKSYVKQQE